MKNLFLFSLFIALGLNCLNTVYADVRNPVGFIGQAILGSTAGAPLSTDANSQLVSGTSNSEASATGTITTASTTDVLMTSMSITPTTTTASTWFVIGSTCVDHSAQSVAVSVTIYAANSAITHSVRAPVPRFNGVGANSLNPCISTQAVVTVNGSTDAIELRWKVASGTGTAHQRSIFILRLI